MKVPKIVADELTGELGYWMRMGGKPIFVSLETVSKGGPVTPAQITKWADDLEHAEHMYTTSAHKIRKELIYYARIW